eukprot:TRINITY_DN9622_c0_g2_i1.p1 TRINITY_DN9622_c0_g2~~TRINITY_DN9622_c0_g2_i1.p1  ORF type:complete len:184 (+),score=56.50 TRINITY_DN9622_c0_g2_i1:60-554(+)
MDKEKCHTHGSEIEGRGLSDFLGKKDKDDVVVVSQFEKVHISGQASDEDEEEKPSLLEKLHRSNSSSSSSPSDEEADEKKKKKGLKEKVKKKTSVEKADDTTIPIERVGEGEVKINGKLPGGRPKKAAKDSAVEFGEAEGREGEAAKEKKGILEKIKEKLPGYY